MRRRASALGIAFALHAAALWALIVLPPAMLPQVERAATAISVRLYTVAGGADAETDAPLFEPPLAGGRSGVQGETSERAAQGADEGADEGGRTDAARAAAAGPTPEESEDAEAAPAPAEPAEAEAEPQETVPAEPIATAPQSTPAPAADAAARTQPGPTSESEPEAQPVRPAPAQSALRDPGAPVATTQPSAEPAPAASPAPGPPSFADIVARAESRLNPDDYRLLVNFGDGVNATVREGFCLSSVDANREAFDCPEGVNPDSARLAQFGLMGLGEEPPEFLEDMDRLAFELATLGADDNTITRILTALRNERRAVIEAGPLRRQYHRDRLNARTDNLGNPVDGPPMPGNPGGG